MTTSNVSVLRTGTGWTVDVTPCNLDSNLGVKDFVVLHNGVATSNAPYQKTTVTTLTYTGIALASNTQIEIRRRTPPEAIAIVQLGSRVRSDEWNNEFQRVYRKLEEYDLNGAGSPVNTALPLNDPFGVVWDGDLTYPPSRNSVYDWGITRAPLASPVFTGVPTVPTPAPGTNTTQIASTAYVVNALSSYAPLASPNFSGNPTAPTQADSENSTRLATTAWTRTRITNSISGLAPLASPNFTGTPTAPTPVYTDTNTRIATAQSLATRLRVYAENPGLSATTMFTVNTFTGWTELTDEGNDFNPTSGVWTCPVTGIWTVTLFVPILATGVTTYGSNYYFGIRNVSGGVNDTSEINPLFGGSGSREFAIPISVTKRFTSGTQYSFYCFLEAAGGSMAVTTNYGTRYLSIEFKRP